MRPVTCERMRPLLSAYQDDALPPEERARVRAHVSTCAACRAVLAAYETMYATLQRAATPAPPDLRRNVYARIAALEARRTARPPFVPALLAMLRAASGTAGLLAVLAALLAAIVRLGAPQHAGVPAAAPAVRGISAAGTALQHVIGAVRSGNLRSLPPEAQTAVAPLGHELAAGAQWKVDKMSVGAARVTVDGHVVRTTRSGAPVAVIPIRVDTLEHPTRGAVVKSVVVGTPSPIPTIPAGDGIVYVHLGSAPAGVANAGEARGDLEWHAFAPGKPPLVLVTPDPARAQWFTGLGASPDGNAVTYAVAGRDSDGDIFRLAVGTPQPTKVLVPDSGLLLYGASRLPGRPDSGPTPRVQTAHLAVGQVFPLSNGRLSFAVVGSTAVSMAITSSHGLQTVAHLGASVRDYAISPDRHAIAWVQQDGRHAGRLEVADLGARSVTQTIGLGSHPVWAPDGRGFLFLQGTARRASLPALALWSVRDDSIRQLVKPDPDGHQFISAFAWAPGGRFFTYVVSSPGPRGTSAVWLGDAHTGYTWKAFTRRWIGAVAWVHGRAFQTTPGPIAITVQAPGTQQTLGPGGTATVPYGHGFVSVILHFPAPVDWRSVDVRAQPATRRLEVKNPTPGNTYTYAFRVRRDVPGTVDVTLERALDRDGRSLIAAPVSFTIQTWGPPPPSSSPSPSPSATSTAYVETAAGGTPQPTFVPQPVATPTPYDDTTTPANLLQSFYNAINRHDFRRAFSYLSFTDGRSLRQFRAGYANTRYDQIVSLLRAPYITASNDHALTCIGLELLAHNQNGHTVRYGGWYLVKNATGQNAGVAGWRIQMPGTDMKRGRTARVPPPSRCVPPPPTPTPIAG